MDTNKSKTITINSFNCRGARNSIKRQNIFRWLKDNYFGITFLQEVHSTLTDEVKWQREWGGVIRFSHGEFNARGVCILIPPGLNPEIKIIKEQKDNQGRLIMLKVEIESKTYILINVYCPTKDDPKSQNIFLNEILELIDEYSEEHIIIGGDLNTYLEVDRDKKGIRVEKQSNYSVRWNTIMEEYSLIDIWRVRHPDLLQFTRREKSRSGIVQSRLDYFIISLGLGYCVGKSFIKPGICSDHSLININIEILGCSKRGKGYWKFNNSLLTDKKYIEIIKNVIRDIKENDNMENKNTLWEFTKCKIRTETIIYSSKKSKEQKRIEKDLIEKIGMLEQNLDQNDENKYLEYLACKKELENIISCKTNGIIIRSRAKWIEEGEKNTKYFMNLEKRNSESKYIKKLINSKNEEIINPEDILLEEKKFYQNLYSTKLKGEFENTELFLDDDTVPRLDEYDKQLCDSVLTILECGSALKQLPNNKSPGIDGLTTNFYKFFWIDIKDILYNSYIYSLEHNTLTPEQKRGILNLLPKEGKDLRYLANWRPVSLLTTDYKILTKSLAIRLQKVISKIISNDQVGYIKKRYIGENIRTIFNLMFYTKNTNQEAIIAQIDFEKAFDSIEWPFLEKTLQAFNFGDDFVKWVKLLYNNIYACVGNNGHYSNYFELTRSIRQGCPISALLFLLVAEIIAIKIRNNKNINGIKIADIECKINMMADDTTLFLHDINSLKFAIEDFLMFQKCSGLKLNLDKTEIIPIGALEGSNPKIAKSLNKIKIKNGPFKALGIWFSYIEEEVLELNFTARIKKMEQLCNIWRTRCLSLKGKIAIIRSILLPQVQFLFSMLYVPEKIIKKIDQILLTFLWDNKPAKVKKSTIIAPIDQGGLNMVDVNAVNKAAKIGWIRRIIENNNPKCSQIMLQMLHMDKHMLNKNMDSKISRDIETNFHIQVMESWHEIHNTNPCSCIEILNQYLMHNSHLKIGNKCLNQNFLHSNSPNIRILDIVDENGKLTTFQNIKTLMNITQMEYNSLITSIPKKWRTVLKEKVPTINIQELKTPIDPQIVINRKFKSILTIKNNEIYRALINNYTQSPTSITKWIESYPFLEIVDWKEIYQLPYRILREPYLQSFQYKIINRILNCREKLLKWKLTTDDKCAYCGLIDNIEHHLFFCSESKKIWKALKNWMINNLEYSYNFTICEILFGICCVNNNGPDTEILNYLIYISKWYINKNKSLNKPLYFIELLQIIKNKVECIVLTREADGIPVKVWHQSLYTLL